MVCLMKKLIVKYLNREGHETQQLLVSEFFDNYPKDQVVIVNNNSVTSRQQFLERIDQIDDEEITIYVFPHIMGG